MAYTVINFNLNSIELNQIKTLFFLRVLVIAMCKYTAWDTKIWLERNIVLNHRSKGVE